MLKQQAIELLGGTVSAAAKAIDISYQAIDKWPEVLPPRIADRVLAACVRAGIVIPPELASKAPAKAEA